MGMSQTPDSAAAAGDLISREAAIKACSHMSRDGRISGEAEGHVFAALRALPAAPEAGEAALPLIADYLRAPHMDAKREIDERARTWIDGNPDPWVNALSSERDALRDRLAEVEAERDAALAQVAGAYEAASKSLQETADNWSCGHPERRLCDCDRDIEQWRYASEQVRSLTPADATAAFERAVEARVQAALAAQGEPLGLVIRHSSGMLLLVAHPIAAKGAWSASFPIYDHPAPASAGVTVKPLVWDRPAWGSEYAQTPWGRYAVGPLLDAWAWCWNGENCMVDTELAAKAAAQADYERRILSAISQPAQAGEG